MKQPFQRFVMLDFYRFTAAIGVVALHFSEYNPNQWLHIIVREFYLFVDFFFILSGLVITWTYSDSVDTWPRTLTYLQRRLARIYPLHALTFSLFAVPIVFLTWSGLPVPSPERYPLDEIPAQITLTQMWKPHAIGHFNYPAWSISVEWAMYLLFPLLVAIQRRSNIALLVISIFGFWALTEFSTFSYNYTPLRALPTFVLGMWLASAIKGWRSPSIMIGVALFISAIVSMASNVPEFLIISMFAASIFFTASAEYSNGGADSHPFLTVLGNASYSIYMLHAFLFAVALRMGWYRVSTEPPPIYILAVLIAVLVPLSMISYRYFESPAKRFLSGLPLVNLNRRTEA